MAMERCDLQCVRESNKSFRQQLVEILHSVKAKLIRWVQLAEQRRQLREMDEHQLKDIGLSRADVERIAGRRWFWDDPVTTGERVDDRYRRSDDLMLMAKR
jgi:uncharacterized protein YjiS (DUF1127 family)